MRGTLLSVLGIFIMAASGQDIDIRGTVVNQAGIPAGGLVLSLQASQLSDTTDSLGKFRLRGGNTPVVREPAADAPGVRLSGNRLHIPHGTGPAGASLKIFDLSGAQTCSRNDIHPGQTISLTDFASSSGMRVLDITYGNRNYRFGFINMNGTIVSRKIHSGVQGGMPRKSGSTAAGDSLIIMRGERVEFSTFRNSLTDSLTIRLDLIPHEVVEIALAEKNRYPDEVGRDLAGYPGTISTFLQKTGTGPHDYEAWCSEFVSWAYRAAGYPVTGGSQGGWMLRGSTQLRSWFQKNAQFIDRNAPDWNTFEPAPGDFIRYDNPEGGHSGIVRSVSNDTLFTVEGNVNNKVMLRKIVQWRTYQSGSTSIDGIGRRSGVTEPVL